MKTPTFNEIKAMDADEIATLNRKLAVRLVLTRIVLPIAAVAAVHIIANRLDKKNNEG